jgi:hypothetical protein
MEIAQKVAKIRTVDRPGPARNLDIYAKKPLSTRMDG